MDKKTLMVLASSVIATGIVSDNQAVQAKIMNSHSNGAIIQQLPRDNTPEFMGINDEFGQEGQEIDRQMALIHYYEKNHFYEQSDDLYIELIGMIKELDEPQRTEAIDKCKEALKGKLLFATNTSRVFYWVYLWEKNFGSFESAVSYLKRAIDIDRVNPQYQYEYAMINLNQNNYDKAIELLSMLKRQYPREVGFRIGLAQAYTQAGLYNDAIREYRVASAFDPANNETIVALNDLTGFTKMAKYGGGYNRKYLVERPVASPDGQRLVAFNAKENQLSDEEKVASHRERLAQPKEKPIPRRSFVVGGEPAPVAAEKPSYQQTMPAVNREKTVYTDVPMSDKAAKKAAKKEKKARSSAGKRVMVSYVNGRKVVKIVNINTDVDTTQSMQEANNTFEEQLEDSNTARNISGTNKFPDIESANKRETTKVNYEQKTQQVQTSVPKVEEKATLKSKQTKQVLPQKVEPLTQYSEEEFPSESKYEYNEYNPRYNTDASFKGETVPEVTETGDPNVSALSAYKGTGRKQLLVSYQNGKRVVQMVGPDGVPLSQTRAEKHKKSKKTEQPAVQKSSVTKNTSAQNTDLYIKANELMAQNQYQQVINVLQNVQPPTLRSLTSIASCYNALGQTDTAIDYYKQADKLSPDNTQILYSIGYLYYTQNNIPAAKKYIDLALKVDPSNANAVELNKFMAQQDSNVAMNQAVSYMNSNNYSEAKKTLEKVLKDNPTDFQAYYYLGHIGYATQKYEDAARNFGLAIKYNPEYPLSYYSIGLAFDKLKEFSKSRSAYEQFLQMETDDNKYTQYARTRVNTIKSKQ